MTLCIAAILTAPVTSIVIVTDRLVSNDFTSAEGFPKVYFLDETCKWVATCQAEDVGRVRPLYAAIRKALGPSGRKSADEVIAACTAAYDSEIERLVNARLSSRGFTRKTLRDSGHRKLGDVVFAKTWEEVKSIHLGVGLLIAGFDEHDRARLFEVGPYGEVSEPPLEVHAIGSGTWAAEAILNRLPAGWLHDDFHANVYRLCAAKFSAERERKVGQETTVMRLSLTEDQAFMFSDDVAALKKVWQDELMAPPPLSGLDIIKQNLITLDERMASLKSQS